jgi:ribosomal-protein-serine acetyltransferase
MDDGLMIDAGNGITLVPLEKKDSAALFALTEKGRERLGRWLPWVEKTHSRQDMRDFISASRKLMHEGTGLNFTIRQDGSIAGVIGFNTINTAHHNVTIGYWLGDGYEGKGIMSAAVKALTDYAFIQLLAERVEIRAATGNLRSRAVPERLGFTLEGILRCNEKLPSGYVDHCVYSMIRDEWEKRLRDARE